MGAAEREELADEAVALALDFQRTMIALIGTHRRRTYAHDFVYGMHQLYMLFAKPWHAATEGNEHAHQDMKKYFHGMACGAAFAFGCRCYQQSVAACPTKWRACERACVSACV